MQVSCICIRRENTKKYPVRIYSIGYAINPNAAFSSAVEYVLKNNPIIDILLETGGSQNIIIMTMNKTAMTGIASNASGLSVDVRMHTAAIGCPIER